MFASDVKNKEKAQVSFLGVSHPAPVFDMNFDM
jgi:hypothetical protein